MSSDGTAEGEESPWNGSGLAATVLKLEEIDKNLYRADQKFLWKPSGGRGVFGGQVVGQALVAAGNTKPQNVEVHSIHCYFIRAGQPDRPILYHVDRLRDGSSFSTRSVKAVQNGDAILTMQVSYHRQEEAALNHQYTMPSVPPPSSVKSVIELLQELLQRPDLSEKLRASITRRLAYEVPIDLKPIDPKTYFLEASSPKQLYWVRAKGSIGDDENLHRCVAAYLSDLTLLRTAMTADHSFIPGMVVSLDHAMWFHSSFRADEWMLYECESPRAVGNRGMTFGRLWKQDGTLAVSVAQEGLIRPRLKKSKL